MNTRTLQGILNDGVEDLLRKIDPLPTLSGKNEKGWDVHYQEKAQRFLDEMNGLLTPLLEMAKELQEQERYLMEFWKKEHISAQEMPRLAQLMEQAANFVTYAVQSLVDKKQEKKIQQVAAQILELKELLCWLTYTDQTDETYENLYQAKMRATRSKERNPGLPSMLRVKVLSQNHVYEDEVTYNWSGPELYRNVFTGNYDQKELDQYFQYKCMEEEESTTPIQVVPLGKEVELVQKNVPDHPLFIKDLGPKYTEYYELTLKSISRCNIYLEEGYTAAWVENCLTVLFGSQCAERLKTAFEKTKEKKTISLIMGRLVACGIYEDKDDATFEKLLQLSGNLKPGTIGRYVNDGRKSEYDRDFSFLPWIENYCNAHRPKTSA